MAKEETETTAAVDERPVAERNQMEMPLMDEHPFSPQNLSKAIEVVAQIKERREEAANINFVIKKEDVDKFINDTGLTKRQAELYLRRAKGSLRDALLEFIHAPSIIR